MQWEVSLLIVGSALTTATLVNWILARRAPRRHIAWTPLDQMDERTVFLFEDDDLVDATAEAHAMLRAGPDHLRGWPRLQALLAPRFEGVSEAFASILDTQVVSLPADDGGAMFMAEWRGGLVRVVISEPEDTRRSDQLDGIGYRALTDELTTLRKAVDGAPNLVWREDESGVIEWANSRYFDLARQMNEDDDRPVWPPPKLFPLQLVGGSKGIERRMSLRLPGEENETWYELTTTAHDDHTMVHAIPVDRLVQTERNLREFLQTLTKTFAHLPTGLAVFDRSRRLVLFNPALTDLSALEPTFLSSRPTLYEFLDRLRERQRMPEPKDYKTWRRQISEMEAEAATGTHQETWTLPTGQTFRITGRPHPEGAVAFLFEDISTEITTTRRFRAEIEMSQAVLDSLHQGIAVFSSAGTLIQTNSAYRALWNHQADKTLGEISLVDAFRFWADHSMPNRKWADLRNHALRGQTRQPWTGRFVTLDEVEIHCEFVPLQGNGCRVSFTELSRGSGPDALQDEQVTVNGVSSQSDSDDSATG